MTKTLRVRVAESGVGMIPVCDKQGRLQASNISAPFWWKC